MNSLVPSLYQELNVKDFGATGDGTTDDTAAIQAAIDAAQAIAASGGNGSTIYLPDGRYYVTSTLLINQSRISFIGESKHGTQIYGVGVVGAIISINNSVNDTRIFDIEVANLTLIGSSTPNAADIGLGIYCCVKGSFRNLRIGCETDNYGFYMTESWENHFYDIVITSEHTNAAMCLDWGVGGTDSPVNANSFHGVNLQVGGATPIGLLTVDSNATLMGVNNSFYGITIQGFTTGIWIKEGEGTYFHGLYCENNTTDIRLGSTTDTTYARHVTIGGYTTLACTRGIHMDQCRNVTIIDPFFKSGVTYPITIGEATGVTLMGLRNAAQYLHYESNAEATHGVMILEGDVHRSPTFPGFTAGTASAGTSGTTLEDTTNSPFTQEDVGHYIENTDGSSSDGLRTVIIGYTSSTTVTLAQDIGIASGDTYSLSNQEPMGIIMKTANVDDGTNDYDTTNIGNKKHYKIIILDDGTLMTVEEVIPSI